MSAGRRLFKPQPKLGEILLKHTSLSQQQLEEALALHRAEGKSLGDVLIERKMIMPHEIMRALCMQLGIEFIEDLKPNDIDPALVSNIPINYAKSKEVIPVARRETDAGPVLKVALSDPFKELVIEDLRLLTG